MDGEHPMCTTIHIQLFAWYRGQCQILIDLFQAHHRLDICLTGRFRMAFRVVAGDRSDSEGPRRHRDAVRHGLSLAQRS
eukprot:scaffold141854_cov19-Prasinocladus_malaysianus.AAC.1